MKKIILFVALILVATGVWFFVFKNSDDQVELTNVDTPDTSTVVDEQEIDKTTPAFDSEKLQDVVDAWSAEQSGEASVVIYDANEADEPLASLNGNSQYFAASLYKLFVVYRGYQSLDGGQYVADEEYLNGQTRLECLDAAIRSSDSPCGETWWNELGKQELTDMVADLGMINTSLTGISTTAEDVATMMGLIWRSEGLSDEARESYLSSLEEQDDLYRRGLPSGFSEDVTVYNKVGWNLTKEWHDAAIVDFGDDRVLVIAVLSENVGMKNIAKLGTELEALVLE